MVVPAYNAAEFLSATLDSVLSQTYREMEIIVVDDGSTDGTAAVAEQYVQRDSRVRLIRQENAGVGAARNAALAVAQGKYVAPIDSDDVWYPEKIAAQVAVMEAGGEELGFTYCWSKKINHKGVVTSLSPPSEVAGNVLNLLVFRNFLHNASVPLFRSSALQKVGGYVTRAEQKGGQGCEDWEITVRIAEKFKVGVVPQYLVGYREMITGMSSDGKGMVRSYEHMIGAILERNSPVPNKAVRWSSSYFHLYIARKCHLVGDLASSLQYLRKAFAEDPAIIVAPPFSRVLAGCLWRRIRPSRKHRSRPIPALGTSQRRPGKPPLHWRLFSKLEKWRCSALNDRIPSK